MSVDAQWVSDKLCEFGRTMDQLEALYTAAQAIAFGWTARGDGDARREVDRARDAPRSTPSAIE